MKTRIFTNRNKRSARWALLIRQSMKVNTWAPEVSKIRPLCPSILFNIHMLILNIYNYIHIITYIDTLCIYIYTVIPCYTILYHLIPSYSNCWPLHHGYRGDLFINRNLLRQNHSLQDQNGYSDWYSTPKRHQCLISKNEQDPFPFRQMSLRNNRFFVLLWMADAPLCRAKCNIRLKVSVAHTHIDREMFHSSIIIES